MATQLFFINTAADIHRGIQDLGSELDYPNIPSDRAWQPFKLSTARGAGNTFNDASTMTGPTDGVPIDGTAHFEWWSDPISADVTISGTITLNLWAAESNMSANVAINAAIYKVDAATLTKTLIAKSTRTTEVAVTTPAVNNFTVTPTSTALNKGDRLVVVVFGDDAGTMASGFSFQFNFAGTSSGGTGDSFVTFTETFGFTTAAPAGTQLFLTDTASDVSAGVEEREMWTSRGAGVVGPLAHVTTSPGWTAPLQFQSSGSAIEWYSKQLQAFTLGGLIRCNLRIAKSQSQLVAGRVQIARVDADGTNAVVWGEYCFSDALVGTTEAAMTFNVSGDDLAISDGQRLRIRIYGEDGASLPYSNTSSNTLRLWYAGTSGGASGDSFITLTQSVSEFAAAKTLVLPPVARMRDRYGLAHR